MNGDPIETMLVEVRASTQGFAADLQQMRATVDSTLVEGFSRAGATLERGLLDAVRKGGLGFDDLKRIAMRTLGEIAGQALSTGLGTAAAGSGAGSGGVLAGLASSLLGLPGRATGGPVSPGRGYVVGERGPELFVPTSAGRVEAAGAAPPRGANMQVTIQLSSPREMGTPAALQRSTRQVAGALRRAMRMV